MPITIPAADGTDSDVLSTRSEVLDAIARADREIGWLLNDLEAARAHRAQLDRELAYAPCDHPDTSGFRCDHCGQFADLGEDFWNWQDTLRVRQADVDATPYSPLYLHFLNSRVFRVDGYRDHVTQLINYWR